MWRAISWWPTMSDRQPKLFDQDSHFTPRGDELRSLAQLTPEERQERFPALFAPHIAVIRPTVEMSQVRSWREDLNDALFEMEDGTTRAWEEGVRRLEEILHSMDAKLTR